MTRSVDWSEVIKVWPTTAGAVVADQDVGKVLEFLRKAVAWSIQRNEKLFVRFGIKSNAEIQVNVVWIDPGAAVELAIVSLEAHRKLWRIQRTLACGTEEIAYEFPIEKQGEILVIYFKFICTSKLGQLPELAETSSIRISVHKNDREIKYVYKK